MNVVPGLDRLLQSPEGLRGRRVALLANCASVDRSYRYAWDAVSSLQQTQLVSIWSPQHGLFGQQQANMIESPHRIHPRLNVPIYSLYSETRQPTEEMMQGVDLLLIDLQDVGTRVYTFSWTILACLQAAATHGIEVWVLDRPNPIGGDTAEGPPLWEHYKSFVGMECIPMRHGLTLGELATFCKNAEKIDVDLNVISMHGWHRRMFFDETNLPWLPPSPNIPTWNSTVVYPGQVLLEGTNLSEGRGTTRPFECVGAPFVDGERLASLLQYEFELSGVVFRPIRFVPTFDKHADVECGGVFLHVTDVRKFRSLECTVAILMCIKRFWPDSFQWLEPPYEYEYTKMPIDILWGNDLLRTELDHLKTLEKQLPKRLSQLDQSAWMESVGKGILYT
jgi:uncharacterized protein YbbC (DUF1343 family)